MLIESTMEDDVESLEPFLESTNGEAFPLHLSPSSDVHGPERVYVVRLDGKKHEQKEITLINDLELESRVI